MARTGYVGPRLMMGVLQTGRLVAVHGLRRGTKVPNMEGPDMKGLLVLTDNGRWSFQIITEIPKFASNDRLKTTPAEDKAVAHGVLSNFGAYSVNEADKTLSIRLERSSFPN